MQSKSSSSSSSSFFCARIDEPQTGKHAEAKGGLRCLAAATRMQAGGGNIGKRAGGKVDGAVVAVRVAVVDVVR